jgi:hypothetical protein
VRVREGNERRRGGERGGRVWMMYGLIEEMWKRGTSYVLASVSCIIWGIFVD